MLSSQYESTLCSSCSRSPFLSVSFLVALVSLPHLSPLKWELWEVGNLFVLLSDASSVSGMVPEQVLHTCVVWTSWLAHILSWLLLLGAFRTLGSSIFNKWRKGEGQWTSAKSIHASGVSDKLKANHSDRLRSQVLEASLSPKERCSVWVQ